MSAPESDYTKYLNLIKKRKRIFAITALSIMTVVVIVSYLLPKKYEADSTVFIEKNVVSELVKGIAVTPSMEDTVNALTYAINSRSLVLKVINALDLNLKAKSDADTEKLIKQFQKDTEVKVKDKEQLFIISFKHENPRIARDYVNTLVRYYIEQELSSKRGESYDATQFLSDQIKTYKEKMDKADEAVAKFKSEKGGVLGLDESHLLEEINSAQQKLYDLQLRRRLLEGQQNVVKETPDPLLAKVVALQKRLDELRVEYTDSYPEVVQTKSDIELLKQQIKNRKKMNFVSPDSQEPQKIQAELKAIKVTESSLQNYIAKNKALLDNVPVAKSELENLEADRQNQKTMYDQLFTRHGQSEVSKQMELEDKSATFRIVDPAVVPIKPVSPNRVRIILMGIAAGLAGSLGLLVLLDCLDNSVKAVSSLKSLGTPVLAVIPLMQSEKEVRLEKRRDVLLYCFGGAWFSLILSVLAREVVRMFF